VSEMTEAKYSLNIPLPKKDQFDASRQLTIRADHQEELRNSVDALLGTGTFDRLMAQAVQATFPPTQTPSPAAPPAVATSVPAPAPVNTGASAPGPYPAGVSNSAGAACPSCGVGVLNFKNRKDGSGQFLGCTNFPNCRYIAR